MIIKVKKNTIKLKIDYKEFVIIREALEDYYNKAKYMDSINKKLPHKDRFKHIADLDTKVWLMFTDMYKKDKY